MSCWYTPGSVSLFLWNLRLIRRCFTAVIGCYGPWGHHSHPFQKRLGVVPLSNNLDSRFFKMLSDLRMTTEGKTSRKNLRVLPVRIADGLHGLMECWLIHT